MLDTISYFFREVYINMRRNILMSMASISTVLILSLILGFFLIIVVNLNNWSENIVSQIQIVAYLSDGVPARGIPVLKATIETIDYVDEVKFVSKDEALAKMRKKLKNQIELSDIGKNPLPNSFEIKVRESDKIPAVAAALRGRPGIERVRYGEKIANKLITVNQAVHWVGIVIIAALLVSTVFIVSNTIRLTVFARRKEIAVMQLVGAANWFIRWPFLLEGVLQGFAGSLIAFLVIMATYTHFIPGISSSLPFIIMVAPGKILSQAAIVLLATGIMVGATGSLISINKFLKL